MSDTDYIAYALDKLQRFGKTHGVDVVLVAGDIVVLDGRPARVDVREVLAEMGYDSGTIERLTTRGAI